MMKTLHKGEKTFSLYFFSKLIVAIALLLPLSVLGNPTQPMKTQQEDNVLPNLTATDLANASKWYYNEYRGGRNSDAYPHWDWSTDYMCTLDFQGAWQEQNEGTTLQIQNSTAQQSNPADLDNFDSYVYGSKKITADNKILSLRIRTHNADGTSPAYFGVQVLDLSATTPTAVKIGSNQTYGSDQYADFSFDLSDYIGKEVVIAVGIYRVQTGDYYKQLVLRAIRFGSSEVTGTNWLPGTEVISGWQLTDEMVRSTMVQPKTSFTGISPMSGSRDSYSDAYRSWRTVNFVANEWTYVPLYKDPEVFPSEGYIIKANGNANINTLVPQSYLYAKFSISTANDKLTLKTRTFGSNYTFFKLTAIKEDGTVTYLSPVENTALEASSADNGCWKFKNNQGSSSSEGDYASFVYNLSQFNGQNVVLAISVHKGESNTDENKMALYAINFEAGDFGTTENNVLTSDFAKVYSPVKNQLTIKYTGKVAVYDASGRLFETKMVFNESTLSIPSGFYLVKTADFVYKVIVK